MNLICSFTVPIKAYSWNVLARQNRWKVKKFFDEVHKATFYAIKQNNLKPIIKYPVIIEATMVWKQKRRHDIDDPASMKPLLDQLVKSGILKDDSIGYISEVRYKGLIGATSDEIRINVYYDHQD